MTQVPLTSTGRTEVTVVDVRMPFGSMVMFMVKWSIATIPALIILGLVVMVAAGFLGGIFGLGPLTRGAGTPAPRDTRERVYVASMKSDLRNLITAEEAFFADSVKYTARVGRGGLQFAVTTGNSKPVIRLTADGFTATIRNANTVITCAIFVGSTPIPPATNEGEPKCQ